MKLSNPPPTRVIVRAWGDEPVVLFLHRLDNKGDIAFVGQEVPTRRPIGIPITQVFVFDEETAVRLLSAYKTGKMADLSSIYSGCVKYQDSVGYLHDPEHVTGVERTSERGGQ